MVRSCTTAANWWLFRDSLLWSTVFKSPISSVREIDLFRSLRKLVRILCFRFCIPTFETSPSESEISLSEGCASTCISRSSRLTVKDCDQSGMPCVGSSLYICCMLVHGFPWPACQDLSASVSRMHACHFKSWRDLIIVIILCNNLSDAFSMLKTNCCWNRWQSWYDKKYEIVHCTSNWLPIIGRSWSFAVFPLKMNIRVWSKAYQATEPLAFHRVLALLRIDRNHEQKLVLPRLFALFPVTAQYRYRVPGSSPSVHFIWAWISLAQHCAFFSKFHATLLSQSACREVSSGVHSSEPQEFRSWGSPFWIMPPDCAVLSRILFRTKCIPRILWCVPPKRSIPILQLSVEQNSLDLSFEIHNLGHFFPSEKPLLLEYILFLDLALTSLLTISMSILATNATNASLSRLATTTHGMIPIITWRSFSSCQPQTRIFFNSSRRTGLSTVWVFRVSLFLHFRYWRGCLLQVRSSLRLPLFST